MIPGVFQFSVDALACASVAADAGYVVTFEPDENGMRMIIGGVTSDSVRRLIRTHGFVDLDGDRFAVRAHAPKVNL